MVAICTWKLNLHPTCGGELSCTRHSCRFIFYGTPGLSASISAIVELWIMSTDVVFPSPEDRVKYPSTPNQLVQGEGYRQQSKWNIFETRLAT